MALAVAEGVKDGGGNAFVKRVPELMSDEEIRLMHAQEAQIR